MRGVIMLGQDQRVSHFGDDRYKAVKRGRICTLQGCHEPTAEGKPYCPEHVERNPYVAALLAREGTRDHERAELEKGHVDLHGTLAEEMLDILTIGGGETFALSKSMGISWEATKRLARALERTGRVVLSRDARCVALPRKGASA